MSGLPASWATAEVGDFLLVNYGKALAASSRAESGRVPVFGSSGLVGHHDEALVVGACIVVGRKGAAGAVHLVRESCWPIDTAYFIQPPLSIELDYLYHFLSSQPLNSLDKSTAIPSLSRDDLYRVSVPIAPYVEQTRIVGKLEELLGGLDAAVGELKAAQRKLTHYRQSLLKAAMEGALTAQWRAARTTSSSSFPRKRESSAFAVPRLKPLDSRFRGNDGIEETGADLLHRILQERRTRWEEKQLAKFAQTGT